MPVTAVPAVVDALVTALRGQLSGVQVPDGPLAAQDLDPDALVVGITPEGGQAVEVERTREGLTGWRERFAIWCLISSARGDDDVKARRDRCAELLQVVDTALVPGLGGIGSLLIGVGPQVGWTQAQTPQGVVVEVAFSVTGTVLT